MLESNERKASFASFSTVSKAQTEIIRPGILKVIRSLKGLKNQARTRKLNSIKMGLFLKIEVLLLLGISMAAICLGNPMPQAPAAMTSQGAESIAVNENLRDLLHALQLEAAIEAAENREEPDSASDMVLPPEDDDDLVVRPVDKRWGGWGTQKLKRRRYGFWVTAINKMDNDQLRSFLGTHRNIYNVYKRSVPQGRRFIPSLGSARGKRYFNPTLKHA